MKKLRPVKADEVIKALSKIGFKPIRQRGSHLIMKHDDGRLTVIPVHKGEEIGRGLLRKIAFDAKIEPEELIKLIEEA
ncbi:MAG: type II toxin-antitoxin system HicA family toxin [archaeon]|nr:type II toxin-antitoxin system HicA family toxin [archaeon]MCP8315167.1 type II toxin-antitoxin system HicA family toxin [archaeon]MCP8319459.1 type II toxin-antitoxin system HicA family toxin [archaeon]